MCLVRYLLLFVFVSCCFTAYGQQDISFQVTDTYLAGKDIFKVKRDYNDPYLWVLCGNNEIYRINSLTKKVDDFTAQFTSYWQLGFVDIVGLSQDVVYLATNSPVVLEYKNGVIKQIATDGITNGVGINSSIQYESQNSNNTLFISTSKGMRWYDYTTGVMQPYTIGSKSTLYEFTYRNEMFAGDLTCRCYPDTVKHIPVADATSYTIYVGDLWLGGNSFGSIVKTAFYTGGNSPNFVLDANQFWATENGLFQNFWNGSYTTQHNDPYGHYLKGVDIRKITSIMGLVNFGTNMTRENLLVGSTQGLYFSNSKFNLWYSIAPYTFYHSNALGNKAINDICVNATSYTSPICENGVWVGAVDGLYYLTPDYSPYIDPTTKLNAIQFDGQYAGKSNITVCSNNVTAKAIIPYTEYYKDAIKWVRNGVEIPGETGLSLEITQPGDYNAIIYDPCSNIHFQSNHLKITQVSGPAFSFNYPDKITYCDGSTATLKTDDNPDYSYRWYTNGALNGNTTSSLTTTQGGKYKVEVSGCSGSWVASKEVEIDFIKPPQPVVKTDKPAYCNGEQATLSAIVPAIDASNIINWQPYQYRWYTNGVLNGQTTPSITVTQPGKYKVEITSCSDNWTASDETDVNFITISTPIITADKSAYCIGDNATLTTNFVNNGATYNIDWYRDGNILPDDRDKPSVQTNIPGSYTATISSNLISCSQSSVPFALNFNEPPSINIQQIVNTTLCDGETVDLKASYSTGTIQWSTGETSDEISVKQSGNYLATVTTPAGCSTTQISTIQFLANPALSVPDAALCQFTNQTITLTAPAGFIKYEWNGKAGNSTFSTNALGNVTLTVTDINGCKATQIIHITSHCDDIHIPNAFTPNGDGINDTWIISGLEGDVSTVVRVYNRYGTLIFQSKGYSIPWDGTYNGKKVPTGTYYYIINAKANNQILSGPVTVIY
jgi:gliding motility-associated-like protein